MNEHTADRTEAVTRRSRWPGWIWALPLAALAVVGWLLLRDIALRGPTVTVTFSSAQGVKAGDTKVRFKGTEVGKVTDVSLTNDLSHVVITLSLDRSVAKVLTEGTRFWIEGAEPNLARPSSLRAVVTGPSIAMDPGPGKPSRTFIGQENPPQVMTGTPGTRLVLRAPGTLGALSAGAKVSYLGLDVGVVESTALGADGSGFDVAVFIQAPFDRLVRPQSRFWKASGIEFSAGNGLSARVSSVSALLAGAVAFDTPDLSENAPPVQPGTQFTLYDGRDQAHDEPRGPRVPFLVHFQGAVGGLSPGAPVTLRGFHVGQVTAVDLDYDTASGELNTPVTLEIEPSRLDTRGELPQGDPAQALTQEIARLVQGGLRARLDRSPPVIGGQSVTLAFDPAAPPAELVTSGPLPEIPAAASSDIGDITAEAHAVMSRIDTIPVERIGRDVADISSRIQTLVSAPEVKDSIDHLNSAIANLDRVARTANRQAGPLVASLQRTVEAAQRAVGSIDSVMGGTGAEQDRNVAEALQELSGAARSVRSLANYLDRHPEALVQGRSRGGE